MDTISFLNGLNIDASSPYAIWGEKRRFKNIKSQRDLRRRFRDQAGHRRRRVKKSPANIFFKEELGHEQANNIPIALFCHDFFNVGNCSAGICGGVNLV